MHAATLTAVVVFPTPPFWFAMAYTVPMTSTTLAARTADSPPMCGICTQLALLRRKGGCFVAIRCPTAQAGGSGSAEGTLECHPGPPREAFRCRRDLARDDERRITGTGVRIEGDHLGLR